MPYNQNNVLAICYDFDRTLTPYEMQAQGYIQQINENVDEFWDLATRLAVENEMDPNLSYMYLMLNGAKGKFQVKKINCMSSDLRFNSTKELKPGLTESILMAKSVALKLSTTSFPQA